MRKTLLFLLLLSVKLTFGQFRDNFNDGNFTFNPVWSGQASLFSINAAKQLKSSLSVVAQTISLAKTLGVAKQIGRASCREKCVQPCRSRWSPYH